MAEQVLIVDDDTRLSAMLARLPRPATASAVRTAATRRAGLAELSGARPMR